MKKTSKNKKFKCAFCRGKGIQPGSERLSCIVCRGTGKIQVNQPYDLCEECKGSGKKQGTNLYCLLCKGKGVIERDRRKIQRKRAVKKSKSFLVGLLSYLGIL